MANIKAQDLPEKLTKAVKDDRVLMIDSEDYNRLKTQPAEYYKGEDGFSPTVDVTTIPGGHQIEITDATGPHTFDVMDGIGSGDMEKAVYDKNDNGIVDDAERLGGKPASDYVLKEEVQDNINTKTFYLKGATDLATAQEIFERFKAGKNPIIIYSNVSFILSNLFNNRVEFTATKNLSYEDDLCTPACIIYYSGNNVTQVKLNMITSVHFAKINGKSIVGDDTIADIEVQEKLESGTNIKTINGTSILGPGNIEIQGGTGIIDTEMSATSTNAVQNKVIKGYVDNAISSIPPTDLSNYYNKSEINEQMGNKVDSTAYNTAIQDLQDQIDTKANVSSTYTKSETDLLLNDKADSIDVYTKLETDDLLDTKANATDVNTKTFELASFSDLTTGQAILDWYLAGKNPLISHTYSSASVSGKYTLTLSGTTSNSLIFHIPNFYDTAGTGNLAGTSSLNKTKITITFNSNNEVTSITGGHDTEGHFLKADENYATPYTPLYDGSPATKKYVDDSVATKQDELVSGTNIKTINNQSLLGSGNINIQGGNSNVVSFSVYQSQTPYTSTINHNLGYIPKIMFCHIANTSSAGYSSVMVGVRTLGGEGCIGKKSSSSSDTSTFSRLVYNPNIGGTVTEMTDTTVTISWTRNSSGSTTFKGILTFM